MIVNMPNRKRAARSLSRRIAAVAGAALALTLASTAPAFADTQWDLAEAVPAQVAPGSQFHMSALITNVGTTPSADTAVLTAQAPPGTEFTGGSGIGAFRCFGSNFPSTTLVCTLSPGDSQRVGQSAGLFITLKAGANAPPGVYRIHNQIAGDGPTLSQDSEPLQITGAQKSFGVASFDGAALNADGSEATQAGGHPFAVTTSIRFNTQAVDSGNGPTAVPSHNVKDITVDLPVGFAGNPQALPQCTDAQLTSDPFGNPAATDIGNCPVDTQVGTATLELDTIARVPVFNMVPPADKPAELAFAVEGKVVHMFPEINPTDDSLRVTIHDVDNTLVLYGTTLTLWGDPGDPAHDALRGFCGTKDLFNPTSGLGCPVASTFTPNVPFLTEPTSCPAPGHGVVTTLQVASWQGDSASAQFESHANNGEPLGPTGCDRVPFNPTASVQPTSHQADAPTGLDVSLSVPQPGLLNPTGLASAHLKRVDVRLPPGMVVNTSAANGLGACTLAQIGLGTSDPPNCPDSSKIGTVEIDTPLLADPLQGSVYLASQTDNPFHALLALYVVAQGSGITLKLPGQIAADPQTGQLTTTFDDNPQLPFTTLKFHLNDGSRAPLANPACGTYSAHTDLTPWSGGASVGSDSQFVIDGGCEPIGFSPAFTAGTENAQAGAYSPFVLSFSRSDTDQELAGLTVKLPPGVLAKLAGVPECSDAELASAAGRSGAAEQANPSCPAGSQVGTVIAGSGVGPDPFFLSGKVFLTGPYHSAPYGLAVVVPALAGPYDLGTVVVRQALQIDPNTAQVTDVSDNFPTILQGIPLHLRRVDVDLNRPDFTINPTSCDPLSISGALTSTGGMSAPVSSRFEVGGCQELGFSPKLKISLTGKGKTRSGDHPALTATLIDPSGQANIRQANVALPLSLALDPNNSQHVCNYQVAQAVHGGSVACPASTIVGQATAVTPLLSQPLSGPVYLVQGIRFGAQGQVIHTLPSLLVPLRGQIALDLRAQSSVSGGKLVTTFSTIPDAPVSKFVLTINGGPKGLLVITGRGRNICTEAQIANASFGAQSGKTNSQNDTLAKPCARIKVTKARKHKKQKRTMKHSSDMAYRAWSSA